MLEGSKDPRIGAAPAVDSYFEDPRIGTAPAANPRFEDPRIGAVPAANPCFEDPRTVARTQGILCFFQQFGIRQGSLGQYLKNKGTPAEPMSRIWDSLVLARASN